MKKNILLQMVIIIVVLGWGIIYKEVECLILLVKIYNIVVISRVVRCMDKECYCVNRRIMVEGKM